MALVLALIAVLTLAACGHSNFTFVAPFMGELIDTAQIVEDGDVIYLIGEGIALAQKADLEAARAAYPELVKPAE